MNLKINSFKKKKLYYLQFHSMDFFRKNVLKGAYIDNTIEKCVCQDNIFLYCDFSKKIKLFNSISGFHQTLPSRKVINSIPCDISINTNKNLCAVSFNDGYIVFYDLIKFKILKEFLINEKNILINIKFINNNSIITCNDKQIFSLFEISQNIFLNNLK